jgi:hypothetical protein
MEYDERLEAVEREIEKLQHESDRLGDRTEQTRSEWESAKSDPSKAPGAQDPEATGPHNIDAEDPATGRKYGELRKEELDDALAEDSDETGG